ncbi:MAG: hypothetical protein HYX94_03625 [Chloroflexi bacterium]|nr:hypothetical protein [Chloroflexota bacterium]
MPVYLGAYPGPGLTHHPSGCRAARIAAIAPVSIAAARARITSASSSGRSSSQRKAKCLTAGFSSSKSQGTVSPLSASRQSVIAFASCSTNRFHEL